MLGALSFHLEANWCCTDEKGPTNLSLRAAGTRAVIRFDTKKDRALVYCVNTTWASSCEVCRGRQGDVCFVSLLYVSQ